MQQSNKIHITVNSEKYTGFTAGSNDSGKRADRIIRQFVKNLPLSGIYKAFRKGLIRINDKKAKPEDKISEGDSIFIYNSLLNGQEADKKSALPAESSLNNLIIYEDDDLIALNKKKGMLVHGEKGSLEERVRMYLKSRIPDSLSFNPGPLHRLDRNTSGLIFFSKSIGGARAFSSDLQNKKITKFYITLLDGKLRKKEQWVDNLHREEKKKVTAVNTKGKISRTTAIPLYCSEKYTLALIKIETGRTHQIRAQASYHGHPLSGDRKYGGTPLREGYFLHSYFIRVSGNDSGAGQYNISASLSKVQIKQLNRIFSNCTIRELEKIISAQLEAQ